MVIISTGDPCTKPISIEAIVKESRPLYAQPLSGYYQVHGKLQFFEISSPYKHENEDEEILPVYGQNIGGFTISGVVEQEGYVLAFRYEAKETFQPKTWRLSKSHPEGPEGIKKKIQNGYNVHAGQDSQNIFICKQP